MCACTRWRHFDQFPLPLSKDMKSSGKKRRQENYSTVTLLFGGAKPATSPEMESGRVDSETRNRTGHGKGRAGLAELTRAPSYALHGLGPIRKTFVLSFQSTLNWFFLTDLDVDLSVQLLRSHYKVLLEIKSPCCFVECLKCVSLAWHTIFKN